MTPEELNRKIEFLIQHSADFAVRFERDHESMAFLAGSMNRLAELVHRRLDRNDAEHQEFQQALRDGQRRHEELLGEIREERRKTWELHKEMFGKLDVILLRLDVVLGRLADRTN